MQRKTTKYQEINLSDFALFLSVMRNREAYENVLSIILNEPDLVLEEVKVEQVILNKQGKRAIRLDAWARDSKNRQFNTEMQNDTDSDDVQKRARFYQGLLDTPILKSGKGTKYRDLPATIIIFITQDDIFGKDLAMYTFMEQCKEISNLNLQDETKKIFLNMKSKNGRKELVSLLQYMKDTDIRNPEILVKDKRIEKLDEIVTEVKESEEWEDVHMSIFSQALEQGREDGLRLGRTEGLQQGIQQGMQQGIQQGIQQGVQQGIQQGVQQGVQQGIIRGRQEDILDLLLDCGSVGEELQNKILEETNTEILRKWHKLASRVNSVEEFEGQLNN